jgi:magnesium transporter
MSEARFFHVSQQGKLAVMDSFEKAASALQDGGYMWLDFYRPDRDQLTLLARPLGLHPLSVEDCTDANQMPKIEDYQKNTFIIFNALEYAAGSIEVDEVDIFLGPDYLITISGYGSSGARTLKDIEQVVRHNSDGISQGPAFLLHVVLDYVVDRKFAAIEALEEELTKAEEQMLASPSSFNPARLLDLRRHLLAVRKSLFHEREILVKICRRDSQYIPEKSVFHFRDIYDHLAKFFELAEAYREIVTSLMELHMSMLNNMMAKTANETNTTVRRLTFITTIFMPLTLLAGIFGMSEWTMMTGQSNWQAAYPAFFLVMALVGIVNYFILRKIGKKESGPGQGRGDA